MPCNEVLVAWAELKLYRDERKHKKNVYLKQSVANVLMHLLLC